MGKYIAKKILWGLLTVFVVLTVVFILIRRLPTDYFFTTDQLTKLSESEKDLILETAGLKDPILTQLKDYYGRLFRGDFGISRRIQVGVPVAEIIAGRIGISFKLGLISLLLAVFLGVLMGIMQTLYKDKLGDHLGTAYTIFIDAVPTVVAFSLIMVLGTKVFHLPTIYSRRVHPVSSLIMPVLCMALPSIAGYALWTRRYMVDELNKDYIKLCKMKGMSNFHILFRHVLRNAVVPLVQYLPTSLLFTIGGSMLVESFFSIPGMGSLFTSAIQQYDLDVVQTLMLIFSGMSVGGILLGDLLMAAVDPRIKLSSGKEATR